MSIDLPTGSPPARVAFYNDPKVRSIAYQVALCAVVGVSRLRGRPQRHRQSGARAYRLRIRLLEPHGRLRHQPDFDQLQLGDVQLWPRLLGRAAQYAAGGRARHRVRDHSRLHRRHRAAVEELAGGQDRRRLRRDHPQYPAAAAIAVLVQRRAQGAAGDSGKLRRSGRHLSQQSRAVPAAAGVQERLRLRADRVRRRRDRRDRLLCLGAQAAGADRPAGAGFYGRPWR